MSFFESGTLVVPVLALLCFLNKNHKPLMYSTLTPVKTKF